jgi:hypothetical protein
MIDAFPASAVERAMKVQEVILRAIDAFGAPGRGEQTGRLPRPLRRSGQPISDQATGKSPYPQESHGPTQSERAQVSWGSNSSGRTGRRSEGGWTRYGKRGRGDCPRNCVWQKSSRWRRPIGFCPPPKPPFTTGIGRHRLNRPDRPLSPTRADRASGSLPCTMTGPKAYTTG